MEKNIENVNFNNLKKGLIWTFSGSGVQGVLKISVLAYMARYISAEEFGVANMALIVIAFSELISNLGVGPAIVQKKQLRKEHIYTAVNLSILMGLFFTLLIYFTSGYIAKYFNMLELIKILKVLSYVFLLESFSLVSQALLQRNLKFKLISVISVISYLIGYGIVGVIFSYLNYGVWALVFAHLSQTIIRSILFIIFYPPIISYKFGLLEFKELIYFGGGFTIARIANYLANQGDNIIIGKKIGAEALGFYGRAYQFVVMPVALIGTALDKVLFPIISKIQNDLFKIKRLYMSSVFLISIITVPLTIIFYLLAPEIINVILGSNWNGVILPFQILSLGLYFRVAYRISDSLLRAKGLVYKRALIQIVYAICVFIGALIGQYYGGINGVAIAIVISIFINYSLLARLSLKCINGSWYLFIKMHLNGLFLGIIIFPILYITLYNLRLIECSNILILIVTCLESCFIVFCIYKITMGKILGENGLYIIDKIKSRK